jgi:hypothetical protein
MINYQFGDIDAHGSQQAPPRRHRRSARPFSQIRFLRTILGHLQVDKVQHPVTPRDLQVIDEDLNRRDDEIKEDTCLL